MEKSGYLSDGFEEVVSQDVVDLSCDEVASRW